MNQCKCAFVLAALAAMAVAWLAPHAQASCVIAPDGKSMNVVTDNPSGDEKNCAVKCQVDTKIGVVQVGCGGNTPPLAKAHSLCDFDKPEAWYKKVVSSEDTCKGGPRRPHQPLLRPSPPSSTALHLPDFRRRPVGRCGDRQSVQGRGQLPGRLPRSRPHWPAPQSSPPVRRTSRPASAKSCSARTPPTRESS